MTSSTPPGQYDDNVSASSPAFILENGQELG